jgi:nucleoside-diphosphate-sugar epimerase
VTSVRVFVAGATGVLGVRLVPLLVAAGHDVTGMTRSPARAELVRSLGAKAVVCDVYDAAGLKRAVVGFAPQALVHLVTDLPDDLDRAGDFATANARARREGTRNLVSAARAAAARPVAQSVAWELLGDAGRAVEEHERVVLQAAGVVVRYGRFYGPGTYFENEPPAHPRIHVDDAARRTVPAIEASSGVILVTEG